MSIGGRLNKRLTRLAVGRHLPRRTVRVRLTLLYGGLFLLSGAALVATTYVLFERATEYAKPQLPRIPRTPAIQRLELLPPLAKALPQLAYVQSQLSQDQHMLGLSPPSDAQTRNPLTQGQRPLAQDQRQLAQDQRQLARDQHQLAQAVNQLSQAVHQMTRAGSAEAAQRAADSHQLLVDSGIALAIVAVLALLAGWLIAGRMLRPIRTITRKAQRISSASLHERLALDGPQDELKELGDTLDDLLARLDAAFEAQRQFVANASHELRTPLTRQRALIQVALANPESDLASLRSAHERVLASEQHLEQMIDGLLTLTRGQAGLEHREHLDLAALASQAMLARESEAAGLDLDVRATLATAPTAGDPRLVERLIANLIDNAIRHNTPGGHVEITTGTRDQHAFVSVANTGPTVPSEQIQRLFQPFQRLNGARIRQNGGHGLGLSIVHAIATAHGAELSARARPEGGLTIEVAFPSPIGADCGVAFAVPRTKRAGPQALSETESPARG
jgi:signal transduction histidine kinase